MAILVLFIGAVILVSALRGTQGQLSDAITQDGPAFIKWAAALCAVAALGFVPGIKPISRALLALILTVLILTNYKQILAGFQSAWQSPPAPGKATDPAAQSSSSGGIGLGGSDTGGSMSNLASLAELAALA